MHKITNKKAMLISVVMLMVPLTSNAVPVTVDFTGTVSSLDGAWASQGAIGSLLSGSYTYDTNVVDTNTNAALETFTSPTNQVWNITVNLGTTQASWDTGVSGGLPVWHLPKKKTPERISSATLLGLPHSTLTLEARLPRLAAPKISP